MMNIAQAISNGEEKGRTDTSSFKIACAMFIISFPAKTFFVRTTNNNR
jgi:hypothetical protein